VNVGLLVVAIVSLLLLVFLLIENLESLVFTNRNGITGTTDIQLFSAEADIKVSSLEAEHKTIKTVTGFVPERNRIEERSEEEKKLTEELQRIVGQDNDLSVQSCLKGLELLAQNESTVQTSWTHTLNKARLLAVSLQLTEAERIAFGVIRKFSHSNEAIGVAHEVLSFIEEFREPQEKGAPYEQWLKKRHEYVMKGLKFFPTGHDLLMNAFEIATLQGDAGEVLTYLNRAFLVDAERTRKNLIVNPLTQAAMRLSREVRKTVNELIKGDNEMKISKMKKAGTLILALVITTTLISFSQFNGVPRGSVSVPIITTALREKVQFVNYFLRHDGTGFGRTFTAFKRIGTGLGK